MQQMRGKTVSYEEVSECARGGHNRPETGQSSLYPQIAVHEPGEPSCGDPGWPNGLGAADAHCDLLGQAVECVDDRSALGTRGWPDEQAGAAVVGVDHIGMEAAGQPRRSDEIELVPERDRRRLDSAATKCLCDVVRSADSVNRVAGRSHAWRDIKKV
jgi:hypothetical protein